MHYPTVLDEWATLDAVLAGKSLARYGDGEFKLADNRSIKCQQAHPDLCRRLREILHDSGDCLVGIPTMDPNGEKYGTWLEFFKGRGTVPGLARYLDRRRIYHSAFVSRPDSAPYAERGRLGRDSVLNTPEYWARVRRLWEGRPVTLVRGSSKSFTGELLIEHGAGPVTEIIKSRQHAWSDYADIRRQVGDADYILLSLGPTATVLAADFCAEGRQAVDVGILGMFFKKHLRGLPMWVLPEDKIQ